MYFHWRFIAVLTRNPTVFMFVYISDAPKLWWQYSETWNFYAFRAVGVVENISGFNLIANEDVGILSPSIENAPNRYNVLVLRPPQALRQHEKQTATNVDVTTPMAPL